MQTDPEEAIERPLALLDLRGKVRLVTGATFWTTQADQTIGLRSMVLSDGPVGFCGQPGGRPAPLNQPPRAGWSLLCRGRTAHGAPPWPPRSIPAWSRRRRWTTRYGASCGWQHASALWKE